MALQESRVRVLFQGGIETKADPKTVPTTKLLALENGVFTKGLSIVKRNGYEDLSLRVDGQDEPIDGAIRMSHRDDELLVHTWNRAYSYQPDHDHFADAGPCFSALANDRPGVLTGTMQTMPDHATAGGVTVYAWEDSRGGVWWSAVDSSTGRVCRASEQLDAQGTAPRCVPCGDALHVYWANATQRSIFCIVCNPAAPGAAVTVQLLVEDLHTTNTVYDAEPTTYPGAPAAIVWAEFATSNFRIAFVHPSGVLGSPVTALPTAYRESGASLIGPVAISTWRPGNASKLAVTALTSSGVQTFCYTLVTAGAVTSVTPASTVLAWDTVELGPPGTVQRLTSVMLDDADATSGEPPVWIALDVSNAAASLYRTKSMVVHAAGSVQTLRSVGLVSRAFQYRGDVFVTVVHDTTYFNTYLTVRLSDFFPIGRHLAGGAAGLPARRHVASVHMDGSAAALAVPWRERLLSENHDKFRETGLRVIDLDFDTEDSHVTAQLGRGLYMAGGCPLHYDGRAWTEQGFHVGPELITATPSSGAGSMTSSSTLEYRAWYEWTDNFGEVHRGPESFGTTVVMGASDTKVTLTVPMLRVTQKTNVRICIARSKGNDETNLYRVTSLDPNTVSDVANGYILNDPTTDSITWVDYMSDATLVEQETIYTDGGIPSNDPPTVGNAIAGGKSRLFFTDASDPQVVRFSQEIDVGYGAELVPELQTRCDPYGGAVTGLGVLDEFAIIFKEHALHTFGGDGPLANGDSSQAGFSKPEQITSDVGCVDPNSIVMTPVGLMFKSAKGIMQIDRSRQVTYIGAPVEAFNAQKIRRATLLPDRPGVIFLTDRGQTLYYDYFFQQWSTFTNHEGYDACVVGGRYYYLRTDGRIFRETPSVYSDAGRAIKLRIETAWIRMTDVIQSWQRFYDAYLLGERKSAHQLKIQMQFDYGKHWSEPVWCDASGAASPTGWVSGWSAGWTADDGDTLVGTSYGDGNYGDGNYGGTPPGLYQWRITIAERAQAVRFRFEDFELVGNAGPSFELTELLIVGGVAGVAPKPFAASRSV